jgi:hypothetical protein
MDISSLVQWHDALSSVFQRRMRFVLQKEQFRLEDLKVTGKGRKPSGTTKEQEGKKNGNAKSN